MNNSGINLAINKTRASKIRFSTKTTVLRFVAIGFLFIVSVSSVTLFSLIALSPLPTLQQDEKKAIAQLSQYHPKMAKLIIVNNRLVNIETLLKQRSDLSISIDSILRQMPQQLVIKGMRVDKKKISIKVNALSLQPLDSFMNNLIDAVGKKEFSKVQLNMLTMSDEQADYTLVIDVYML